jgi:predicted DNA-binding transcriptional regulator AlpA
MLPLLDLNEIARLLGRSPHTIKSDLRRNPSAVPPRLQLPGTKLLRWRQDDVEAWLASLAQPESSDARSRHSGLTDDALPGAA